jgi:hypothetical protein
MSRPNPSSMVSQAARVGAMTMMRPRGPPARRNASRSGGKYASRTGRGASGLSTTSAPGDDVWDARSRCPSACAGQQVRHAPLNQCAGVLGAQSDAGGIRRQHLRDRSVQKPRGRWRDADAGPSGNPSAQADVPAPRHPSRFGTSLAAAPCARALPVPAVAGNGQLARRPWPEAPSERPRKGGCESRLQYGLNGREYYPSAVAMSPYRSPKLMPVRLAVSTTS